MAGTASPGWSGAGAGKPDSRAAAEYGPWLMSLDRLGCVLIVRGG